MEVSPVQCCSTGGCAELVQDVEGALSQPKRQRELAEMALFWGLRLIPEREVAGSLSRKNISRDRGARRTGPGREQRSQKSGE